MSFSQHKRFWSTGEIPAAVCDTANMEIAICDASVPAEYKYIFLDEIACDGSCSQPTSFVFSVKSSNDVHIALRDTKSNDQSIEIVIGGWSNSMSVLRNKIQGTNLVEYKAVLLDANQFKPFWVSWEDSQIKVGTGNDVGQNTFMEANIAQAINHVGISGWPGAPGEWAIEQLVYHVNQGGKSYFIIYFKPSNHVKSKTLSEIK